MHHEKCKEQTAIHPARPCSGTGRGGLPELGICKSRHAIRRADGRVAIQLVQSDGCNPGRASRTGGAAG